VHVYAFRLHCLHVVHRCGLLLQMSHITWLVCVCVGQTGELWRNGCTNREAVWEQTCVGPRNLVLDGGHFPTGRGTFDEDTRRPIVMYLRMTALHTVHLPPFVTCLSSIRGRRMHSLPRGVTRWWGGLLPNCFWHLYIFFDLYKNSLARAVKLSFKTDYKT